MKNIFSSLTWRVVVLSLVLGGTSGALSAAWVSSSLSDYASQLNGYTRPLPSELGRVISTTVTSEVSNRFADRVTPSLVSVYQRSQKTTLGYTREASVATGVIVTSDGWIMLPSIPSGEPDAFEIQVKDRLYSASRIVTDPLTQFVFIKCAAENLPVVQFGSAHASPAGSMLFAASSTFDLTPTTLTEISSSQGVVLASDQPSKRYTLEANVQKNGAPVFDASGSFVGFTVKKDAQALLAPLDDAEPALGDLLQKKTIARPSLGIQYVDLSQSIGISETMTHGNKVGALITGRPAVRKGSAAATAGFMEGDILLSGNGFDFTSTYSVNDFLLTVRAGEKVTFVIDRAGTKKTIDVVLGEYAK